MKIKILLFTLLIGVSGCTKNERFKIVLSSHTDGQSEKFLYDTQTGKVWEIADKKNGGEYHLEIVNDQDLTK